MFEGHYDNWINSRMKAVNKYVDSDYFKSKSLLELGCGHAHIGNKFYDLGAIVTSCDARREHIEIANKKYPHIKTFIMDCDKDLLTEKYNIIVDWGLIYHLCSIESHLENVAQKCDVLFLESEISNSEDDNFYLNVDENGYDQAFNSKGNKPSPFYIEKLLKKNGFEFQLIKDNILNSGFHVYDWTISDNSLYTFGNRRFWICWKNVKSPIKDPTNLTLPKYLPSLEIKRNIAIFFSGAISSDRHNINFESLFKLKNHLENQYNIDFYCSINGKIDDNKKFLDRLNIPSENTNFEIFKINDNWLKTQNDWCSLNDIRNTSSMYYNNYQNLKLILNSNKHYDAVIKYRSEINILDECFNIEKKLEDNTIYIPDDFDHYGLNDQLGYGNIESMKIYCDLYNKIDEYIKKGVRFHPETLLKHHLLSNSLDIKRFPFKYNLNKK